MPTFINNSIFLIILKEFVVLQVDFNYKASGWNDWMWWNIVEFRFKNFLKTKGLEKRVRKQGTFTYRRSVELKNNQVDKTKNNAKNMSKVLKNILVGLLFTPECTHLRTTSPNIIVLDNGRCSMLASTREILYSKWALPFKVHLENSYHREYFLVGRPG